MVKVRQFDDDPARHGAKPFVGLLARHDNRELVAAQPPDVRGWPRRTLEPPRDFAQ